MQECFIVVPKKSMFFRVLMQNCLEVYGGQRWADQPWQEWASLHPLLGALQCGQHRCFWDLELVHLAAVSCVCCGGTCVPLQDSMFAFLSTSITSAVHTFTAYHRLVEHTCNILKYIVHQFSKHFSQFSKCYCDHPRSFRYVDISSFSRGQFKYSAGAAWMLEAVVPIIAV